MVLPTNLYASNKGWTSYARHRAMPVCSCPVPGDSFSAVARQEHMATLYMPDFILIGWVVQGLSLTLGPVNCWSLMPHERKSSWASGLLLLMNLSWLFPLHIQKPETLLITRCLRELSVRGGGFFVFCFFGISFPFSRFPPLIGLNRFYVGLHFSVIGPTCHSSIKCYGHYSILF